MRMKHTMIERVRITGKMTSKQEALDFCDANDFHVTSSGPLPVGKARIDPERFLVVAEKETAQWTSN